MLEKELTFPMFPLLLTSSLLVNLLNILGAPFNMIEFTPKGKCCVHVVKHFFRELGFDDAFLNLSDL